MAFSCKTCGVAQTTMKRCTKCKSVLYCSRGCQIKDWPIHREICLHLKSKSLTRETRLSHLFNTAEILLDDKIAVSMESGLTHSGLDFKSGVNLKTSVISENLASDEKETSLESPVAQSDLIGLSGLELNERNNLNTQLFGNQNSFQENEHLNGVSNAENYFETNCLKSEREGGELYLCHTEEESADNSSSIQIIVKCNKSRQKMTINTTKSGKEIWGDIAEKVRILPETLKVIHKGKKLSAESIRLSIKDKAVFQAVGTIAEREEGLKQTDIDCIMKQMGVDRNTAVKALRRTGELIDAILFLGNR